VTFALLVVLGGVMCAFVSPDVGFDRASLALVIGMSIALVIVTVGFDVPKSIVMRRRFRERGQITALPATIVIAAGCVLASRMLHFRPGLLFGLLAVLTFRREFESRLEGKLAAVACAAILAVSIGAWVAVGPVGAAARSSSSFWLLALEATLSAICVIGLETVTFVLLPVKFMMGSTIMRWSKTTWFVLFVLSGGLYVRILIRPGIGAIGRSSALPSSVVVLAVIPCLISVLFWAYFRFRSDRPTTEPISDEDDADQFAFTDRATTLTA
jgi:hypothetical protein